MSCIYKVLSTLWVLQAASATFFHEPSYIEIQPSTLTATTDFGFTLAYHTASETLVIGAPHHDLNGQVFKYFMKDIFENRSVKATNMGIDIENLAEDYSRKDVPDQNFCLGASIAVYKDVIVTCAPLWSSKMFIKDHDKYGPYGTCFLVNDTRITRYNGPFEQNTPDSGKIYDGTGWSILADEKNDLFLISAAPYPSESDISYISGPSLSAPAIFMDLFRRQGFDSELRKMFKSIGNFVSGHFFKKDVTHYAYSSRTENTIGHVGFLAQPKTNEPWFVRRGPRGAFLLNSEKVGTMFGAALCSSDVNDDGFSDLLVGEPALGTEFYESGTVNVFLGGSKKTMESPRIIIYGNTKGGRFGTTIASTDLDRDGIPEIFVSAPYEHLGEGAVYIISGYEFNKILDKRPLVHDVLISDLTLTQKIQNKEYKSFGYSLKVLPDLDDNGYEDLAIGAPNSAKVLIYRSIPSVTVQVSIKLIDRTVVHVSDTSFAIQVDLDIRHPTKSTVNAAKLLTTLEIVGSGISFNSKQNDYTFIQDISNINTTYSKKITLVLDKQEQGIYKITAKVQGDLDNFLETKGFKNSMVRISPYSKLTHTLPIHRKCEEGENCEPNLSASFIWPGGNEPHVLGSVTNETLTVVVTNKGSETYDSCAKIWIEGSQVDLIDCSKIEMEQKSGYNCPLKLTTDESQKIEILLDMTKQYNSDSMLLVNVMLYNICSQDKYTSFEHKVKFVQDADQLMINGVSHERNVTDDDIESNAKTIDDEHEYILINKGIVTWKSIRGDVMIPKENTEAYGIVTPPEGVDCFENSNATTAIFNCNIDLERKSTVKIKLSFTLTKDKFMENLQNEMLNASSTFVMELPTNEIIETKMHTMTTTFHFVKDKTWGQNKYLIIAIAVIASVIIIGVLALILYKVGFFKRKEKEMLTKLKHDMNQRQSQVPERAVEAIEEENETHDTASML
ncbi:integrin alpha-V-like [Epargyreus clarus]|uniref:integrin alpha-V-like n=1 Tax=Epargyreus clarus TaxID=520877 RepID=UPI003C2E2779